jgi:hypothetical protein
MSIQILNSKDGDQLETVREYEHSDTAYYEIMNRPIVDLEQRTTDLDNLCAPARFLRVRSTATPSGSIEVEVGFKLIEDPLDLNQHTLPNTQAGTQTLVIPACAGGLRRIDMIYYDMDNDTATRDAGTEVAAATPWATVYSANRGKVPSVLKGTNIPLAFLYVDDGPTAFDHIIPIDNAGHIRPCQMGPGMDRRRMGDDASIIWTDDLTLRAGIDWRAARIDHQHPLNINDGITPADQPAQSAGVVGTGDSYTRSDHEHFIEYETDNTQIKKDTSGGSAGSRSKWVAADHRHRANINGAAAPSDATSYLAGSAGSSDYYVHPNHRHAMDGVETHVGYKTINLSSWNPLVDPDLTTSSNLQGRPFIIWWWGHFTFRASNYSFNNYFGVLSQGLTSITAGVTAVSDCWAQCGTWNSGSHEDNSMYHGAWPSTNKEILAIPCQLGNNGARGWFTYPDVFVSFHLDNVPTTSVKPVIKGYVGPGNGAGGYHVPPTVPQVTGKIVMIYMYQRTD